MSVCLSAQFNSKDLFSPLTSVPDEAASLLVTSIIAADFTKLKGITTILLPVLLFYLAQIVTLFFWCALGADLPWNKLGALRTTGAMTREFDVTMPSDGKPDSPTVSTKVEAQIESATNYNLKVTAPSLFPFFLISDND